MNEDEVPQDRITTYGGHKKLFYAVDHEGAYKAVSSSGWDAEAIATGTALEEIDRHKRDAWERAASGTTSPLEYYMHCRRMDLALLAGATGFSRWRIRRHFRPEVHRKLRQRVLARYSEALGIDVATLKSLTRYP